MMKNWPTILSVFLTGGLTSLGAGGFIDPSMAAMAASAIGSVIVFIAHRLESPKKAQSVQS